MIYTIHMHKADLLSTDLEEEERFDSLLAIPEGPAYWAIVVPPVWLAYHRLWLELVIYILAMAVLLTLLASPYGLITLAISGLPGLYLLLEGNQLRRQKADRDGLELVDVVEGSSLTIALSRFLENWRPVTPKPALAKPTRQFSGLTATDNGPGIGLFPQEER